MRGTQARNQIYREKFIARLQAMDEYDFENLVAQKSVDRGVDIIAERDAQIYIKAVIQVKRYGAGNLVTPSEVQRYYSLKEQENADFVVIVTTSDFTKQAKERARDLNVKIINIDEIIAWIIGIDNDKPDEILRKYKILYDDEVLETIAPSSLDPASPVEFGAEDSQCFIATAAFGTPHAEEINELRKFRDEVLLEVLIGKLLVKTYYRLSPPIARWISKKDRRRYIVRLAIISPALWLVYAWRSKLLR